MKNFKKITKIFAAALAATLACGAIPTSAFSFDNVDDSIYIESENVPITATNYAQDMFSHFYADDITYLGFSYEESCGMRLAPGFYANGYDSTINTANVYYFPVIYNNGIVALLTVTENNGEYGYQFGKNDMATALNNINTSITDAAEIVVSSEAFYGITDNGVSVLSVHPEADMVYVNEQIALLSNESDVAEFAEVSNNVVTISPETVYGASVQEAGVEPYTLMGKKRVVPIVDNWTYTDTNGTLRGTCWASCTGSLIDYYNNGTSSSNSSGSAMRHTVKNARYAATGAYSGGMDTAKSYIETYVSGANMTKTGSKLSWSEVKSAILTNNAPCYTRWANASSSVGHAMVLCGYRYEDTAPNNSSYYKIYLMDPNETSIQMIGYGSSYTINSTSYSWVNTLTKN